MENQPDLLQMLAPAVVPEHPVVSGVKTEGFVAGISIPASARGTNDGIAGMTDPMVTPSLELCEADLRVVDIAKSYLELAIPAFQRMTCTAATRFLHFLGRSAALSGS